MFKVIFATALSILVSTSSFAVDMFDSNQGVQPEQFTPESIYGQWEKVEGTGVDYRYDEAKFFVFDYADNKVFKSEFKRLARTSITEASINKKMDRKMKSSLEFQYLEYYNLNNYTKDEILNGQTKQDNRMRNEILDHFRDNPDAVHASSQNSFSIKGYSKINAMTFGEPLLLFTFDDKEIRRPKANMNMRRILSTLETKHDSFDYINDVDFHFLVGDNLYGLDIVDNDTVILYDFYSNNANAMVLKRISESDEVEIKTYRQIIEEMESQ